MMLTGKNAIVYGAAGPIGSAVAKAFAAEGATVHLAGRTQKTLDQVADEIRAAGGQAETGVVDALDEKSVDEHAAAVGRIDISFNLIGHRQSNPDTYPEDLRRALEKDTAARTMLKRAATLSDVGAVAVFAASDQARALTGTALNLTVGAVVN
ncbi:SDR family oxidoreductase [Kribbella sp. NPDC049174]|uniref:SDR family oxidoreductase n=1 Tax=Kribbella sp. NPDC049174 TaxID=3364112 RepID=UPI00371495C0